MSGYWSSGIASQCRCPLAIETKIDQALLETRLYSADAVFAPQPAIRSFALNFEVKNVVHQDHVALEPTDLGNLRDAAAAIAVALDLNDQIDRAGIWLRIASEGRPMDPI